MTSIVYVIEGGEGVGKTTAINNIKTYVEQLGISNKYSFYSGSGGTSIGDHCKNIILEHSDIDPLSQLFLFLTARNELYKKIEIDISNGKTVIVDRGILSTIAIQLPNIKNVETDILHKMLLSVHDNKYIQHVIFLDGKPHNIDNRLDNDWMDEKNINMKWDDAINTFKCLMSSNASLLYTNINIEGLSKKNVTDKLISIIID